MSATTKSRHAVGRVRRVRVRAPAPVPFWRLRVVAFFVGAASLGAEIAAARLLAPYFGASTIIWANTIATVLVALSVGYAVGGRLADRRADMRGLCVIVLCASVLLAIVPFVSDPFLQRGGEGARRAVGRRVRSGRSRRCWRWSRSRCCCSGWSRRTPTGSRWHASSDTGTVTGRLYAISTAGSLFGTFLAALLLIPLIGTHRTFLVFALMLAIAAAIGAGSWRFLAVAAAIGALLVVPPAAIGAGVVGARVIYSTETQYQYARVLQFPSGERWLELNEGVAVHSVYRPWSYLSGGYWDNFLVLPFAASPTAPRRIAILGDAAGTVARAYGHYFPRTRVDAVEIDGELTTIGKRYFGLGGPDLHLYTADARPWLESSKAHYDAIFLDAYRQPYIPFYLVTREFFSLIRAHLNPGGVVVVNVGHLPGSDALEKVVSATLHAVFPYVARDLVDDTNSLVVASTRPVRPWRMVAASPVLPPGLRAARRARSPGSWGRRSGRAASTPTTRRRSNG